MYKVPLWALNDCTQNCMLCWVQGFWYQICINLTYLQVLSNLLSKVYALAKQSFSFIYSTSPKIAVIERFVQINYRHLLNSLYLVSTMLCRLKMLHYPILFSMKNRLLLVVFQTKINCEKLIAYDCFSVMWTNGHNLLVVLQTFQTYVKNLVT